MCVDHREPALGIGPDAGRLEARTLQQPDGVGLLVFIAVLGVDAVARLEAARAAAPVHLLRRARLEVHLDASARGVVEAVVAPLADVEIGVDQPVHVAQDVQVEGGGHAQRVVIGGVERGFILGQVDADQDAAIRPALRAQALQEGLRILGREIADRGAGIEEQAALGAHLVGQFETVREIHAQRFHRDLREALAQARQGVMGEFAGDVDRHVLRRLQERKQLGRLGAVAGAEVDQGGPKAGHARDLGAMAFEDRGLGAGRVIFGQFADGLEQLGAERVVQEFGRNAGLIGAQAGVQLLRVVGVGNSGLALVGCAGCQHKVYHSCRHAAPCEMAYEDVFYRCCFYHHSGFPRFAVRATIQACRVCPATFLS